MATASKLLHCQVEKLGNGKPELVMTEEQFRDWHPKIGGILIPKLDPTTQQEMLPRRRAQMAAAKRKAQAASARAQAVIPKKPEHKPKADKRKISVAIPTVTIIAGDESDDALYAVLTGSTTPVMLVVDDDESGPTHTLLMPNTPARILEPDDLDDHDCSDREDG